MITRSEILMGRDAEFPLTSTLEENLQKLLTSVNILREAYNQPMYVSSGYRPGHYNKDAHGATNSPHLTCEAVDFHDIDGKLKAWCESNLDVLVKAGLYMENGAQTPTWLHVQTRPTKNRIFIP